MTDTIIPSTPIDLERRADVSADPLEALYFRGMADGSDDAPKETKRAIAQQAHALGLPFDRMRLAFRLYRQGYEIGALIRARTILSVPVGMLDG